jgi:hypothetical protein
VWAWRSFSGQLSVTTAAFYLLTFAFLLFISALPFTSAF